MTDALFDADRAAGEYPPKGWGWLDDSEKRRQLAAHIESGCMEEWIKREARSLGVPLPSPVNRYRSPHNLPTPRERELLTVLCEEAAEVIVAASKFLRFGREDGYPGSGRTNGGDLGMEIGDFEELVDRIISAGLTTREAIANGKQRKRQKLAVYLQTDA